MDLPDPDVALPFVAQMLAVLDVEIVKCDPVKRLLWSSPVDGSLSGLPYAAIPKSKISRGVMFAFSSLTIGRYVSDFSVMQFIERLRAHSAAMRLVKTALLHVSDPRRASRLSRKPNRCSMRRLRPHARGSADFRC